MEQALGIIISANKNRDPEETIFAGGNHVFPCTRCQNWPMVTPVYQCLNGHPYCRMCRFEFKCVSCSVPMENFSGRGIRCLAIEQLQPPVFACPMPGCGLTFLNKEMMEIHRNDFCAFTSVPMCKLTGVDTHCRVEFSPKQQMTALRHLEDVHGDSAFQVKAVSGMMQFQLAKVGEKVTDSSSELEKCSRKPKFAYGIIDDRLTIIRIREEDHVRQLTPFMLSTFRDVSSKEFQVVVQHETSSGSVYTRSGSGPMVSLLKDAVGMSADMCVYDGGWTWLNASLYFSIGKMTGKGSMA